jgi:hypothetical protein
MRRNTGKLTQQLPRLAAGLAPLGGWRGRSAISSSSPLNLLTLTACHAAHWCDCRACAAGRRSLRSSKAARASSTLTCVRTPLACAGGRHRSLRAELRAEWPCARCAVLASGAILPHLWRCRCSSRFDRSQTSRFGSISSRWRSSARLSTLTCRSTAACFVRTRARTRPERWAA